MFFSIFEKFSKAKICKLTMPFSLLIFGVFLKNQGLNLQHPCFLTFLKRFALHFSTILKIFFKSFLKKNFKRNRLVALILYIKVSAFLHTLFFTKIVGYGIMLL